MVINMLVYHITVYVTTTTIAPKCHNDNAGLETQCVSQVRFFYTPFFFITSTIFYSYFGEGYTLATGTPVSIEVWIAVARLYPNLSYDIGL
jgi:hypothetical protein